MSRRHTNLCAALLLCALLHGCGGGGEDQADKDHGPVDCQAKPEQCI